jgi:hypothetical protein
MTLFSPDPNDRSKIIRTELKKWKFCWMETRWMLVLIASFNNKYHSELLASIRVVPGKADRLSEGIKNPEPLLRSVFIVTSRALDCTVDIPSRESKLATVVYHDRFKPPSSIIHCIA